MAFTLPDLAYDYSALEPYIDTRTMQIHHGKHHAGYVTNLNNALVDSPALSAYSIEKLLGNIEEVPEKIRQVVINNAGGHANHSLFWEIMTPKAKAKPEGDLLSAIESEFGDFPNFQSQFSTKATSLFGSGWVFLIVTKDKKLTIKRHSFQNSPVMHANKPILALDVWEHAYYLKYQNKRADYITAWWHVVNWEQVGKLFLQAV